MSLVGLVQYFKQEYQFHQEKRRFIQQLFALVVLLIIFLLLVIFLTKKPALQMSPEEAKLFQNKTEAEKKILPGQIDQAIFQKK